MNTKKMVVGAACLVLWSPVLAACGEQPSAPPLAQPAARRMVPAADTLASPDPAVCPAKPGLSWVAVHHPPDTVHLRDAFTTDVAFVCRIETRRVPGDGEWTVRVVDRVTGGYDELLAAYARPDARLGDGGGACTFDLPAPLVVWLQRGDDVLPVRAPRDGCGKPTAQAWHAYDALTLDPVEEIKLTRMRSEFSVETGCGDAWPASEPSMSSNRLAQGRLARHPVRIEDGALACAYEVRDEVSEPETADGLLRGGSPLTAAERQLLETATREAPVSPECVDAERGEFLLVSTTGVAVLLTPDGCVAQEEGAWRIDSQLYRDLLAART